MAKMFIHIVFIAVVMALCYGDGTDLDCNGVLIISREEWESPLPRYDYPFEETPNFVFIHHTMTDNCTSLQKCKEQVRQFQQYEKKVLDYNDIGVNFLIGGDGHAYEGRGWNVKGEHTKGYPDSIGIAFIGDYNKVLPTRAMLFAARNLIECGIRKGKLVYKHTLHGHRDASCSECPGDALYNEIRTWPRYGSYVWDKEFCDK